MTPYRRIGPAGGRAAGSRGTRTHPVERQSRWSRYSSARALSSAQVRARSRGLRAGPFRRGALARSAHVTKDILPIGGEDAALQPYAPAPLMLISAARRVKAWMYPGSRSDQASSTWGTTDGLG